jgi:hypothetical protein
VATYFESRGGRQIAPTSALPGRRGYPLVTAVEKNPRQKTFAVATRCASLLRLCWFVLRATLPGMAENGVKALSDFIRVLLGIDTGAAVLIATVVRNPVPSHTAKLLLAISIAAFVISILGCVFFLHDLTLMAMADEMTKPRPKIKFHLRAFALAIYMFFIGVVSLSVFVILSLAA